MSLNADKMAEAIGTAMKAANFESTEKSKPFFKALSAGIIKHIQEAAEVSTIGTANVAGGSSSGKHETTATGKIS